MGTKQGSPPPCVHGWPRSRFWALADECSDNDDDEEACGAEVSAERGRTACFVGDFVARAEELGGSFKVGRWSTFAPGCPAATGLGGLLRWLVMRLVRCRQGRPGVGGRSCCRRLACFSSLARGRSGRERLGPRRRRRWRKLGLPCLGLGRRRPLGQWARSCKWAAAQRWGLQVLWYNRLLRDSWTKGSLGVRPVIHGPD
ncbi:hypothetical protein VPH35_122423 [Triticum aestivum]